MPPAQRRLLPGQAAEAAEAAGEQEHGSCVPAAAAAEEQAAPFSQAQAEAQQGSNDNNVMEVRRVPLCASLALLMPRVTSGSLYRCGKRTTGSLYRCGKRTYEQPVGYGRRKGA